MEKKQPPVVEKGKGSTGAFSVHNLKGEGGKEGPVKKTYSRSKEDSQKKRIPSKGEVSRVKRSDNSTLGSIEEKSI